MNTIAGLTGQPLRPFERHETNHLRKTPIYIAPGRARPISSPYVRRQGVVQGGRGGEVNQTVGLEVGTQAKLIGAAARASDRGSPINTLLTVRWESLLQVQDFHPLRAMQTPERIRHLAESFRKWQTYRDIPPVYLWVREAPVSVTEHFHMGLHIPEDERPVFASYVEKLLGEDQDFTPRAQATRGEFAYSVASSWHLAGEVPDGKPQFVGYWIAAYLGKGEPSQRLFRGKLVNNTAKPERGRAFGGTLKTGAYDIPQGNIRGTTSRKGRFDIARGLK